MIGTLMDAMLVRHAEIKEQAEMQMTTRDLLIEEIDRLVEKGGRVEENHPYEKELIAMQHRLNIEMQFGKALLERMDEWSDTVEYLKSRNDENEENEK
jgi:hypothetical protein